MPSQFVRVINDEQVPMRVYRAPSQQLPDPDPGLPSFAGDPGAGKLYYGVHVAGGNFASFESANNCRVGIARVYYTGQTNYSSAQHELDNGRLPWVSTKVPNGNWAAVANGSQDAWIDNVAAALAGLSGGPVWFCLHHEPRGDGDPSDFRAMWERFVPRAKAAYDLSHVAFAPILNGYSFTAPGIGTTQPQPDVWLPNTELDFCGFDQYNQWFTYNTNGVPGVSGGHQNYRVWHDVEHVIGKCAEKINSWGLQAGCAEHAVHYAWQTSGFPQPKDSADWIDDAYQLALDLDMVALCYYASGVNSPRGTWEFDVHDRPPDYTTKYPDDPNFSRKARWLANAAKPTTHYLPQP